MTNATHSTPTSRGRKMRRIPIRAAIAALALLGPAACDYLDPTGVDNPTVTEDAFLGTPNAAAVWTRGVERQLASTVSTLIMGVENVSDNVTNNRTLFSKVFDFPEIKASDADVLNIQQSIHRLREMANTGLAEVVPADAASTNEIRAQLHFARGYANLLAAENFVALPAEKAGPLKTPAELVALAVTDFEQTRTLSADATRRNSALLAIARAHYVAGNRAPAVAAATTIRTTVPTLLRNVQYDPTFGPGNAVQGAIFESAQGEYQPLPRLDFLFPKYYSTSATDQKPIAILKGEEAFLIIAEAQIATDDLAGARATLSALIDLVAFRPTASFFDRAQQRGRNSGMWVFPNDTSIAVKASPAEPAVKGLVLTRGPNTGAIRVPTVSGTSVTRAMVAAAATDAQLLELLYLMRQEIFVVEGRRMSDLGIRFPVSDREAALNENFDESHPALDAQLPAFIPGNRGLDSFDYKAGDKLVTIHNNMNRVIVANRASPAVAPFH